MTQLELLAVNGEAHRHACDLRDLGDTDKVLRLSRFPWLILVSLTWPAEVGPLRCRNR